MPERELTGDSQPNKNETQDAESHFEFDRESRARENQRWADIKDDLAGRVHGEEGKYTDTDRVIDGFRDFCEAIDSYRESYEYVVKNKWKYERALKEYFSSNQDEEKSLMDEYRMHNQEQGKTAIIIDNLAFRWNIGEIVHNVLEKNIPEINRVPDNVLKYDILMALMKKMHINFDITKYFPEFESAKKLSQIRSGLPVELPKTIMDLVRESIDQDTAYNWWVALRTGRGRGLMSGWDSDMVSVSNFLKGGSTPFGNTEDDKKNYFLHLLKNYSAGLRLAQ